MSETEFPCTTDFCNLPFVAKFDQERTTGDGFQEFNFSCSFTCFYILYVKYLIALPIITVLTLVLPA